MKLAAITTAVALSLGCTGTLYVGTWIGEPPPDAQADAAPLGLSVSGTQIVDAQGNVVRLRGLDWSGLETAHGAPVGLSQRGLDDLMAEIAGRGFNTIRLPFCGKSLDAAASPAVIDPVLNPGLVGRTGIELLDAIVMAARRRRLFVVLARTGTDPDQSQPLWYANSPYADGFLDDWPRLAGHYANDADTVVAFDLHDEPRAPAGWHDGSPDSDWQAAAQAMGERIAALFPSALVVVQGLDWVNTFQTWPGENLLVAGSYPVNLPGRVVYSAHDWPPSRRPPFTVTDYPSFWQNAFGYLEDGIAPVFLGAFGVSTGTPDDDAWQTALTGYVNDRQMSYAFWSIAPTPEGAGLFLPDWRTIDPAAAAILTKLAP